MRILLGEEINFEHIKAVVSNKASLALSKKQLKKIRASQKIVKEAIKKQMVTYGVNTGFGKLCQQKIAFKDLVRLQENLIRSHCAGLGQAISPEETRLMIFLRAHSLSRGYSGVSAGLIRAMIQAFNSQPLPVIPEKGSVGASGDLIPLAHLGLYLMGETDRKPPRPYKFLPKEAISLINGTQYTAAVLGVILVNLEKTLKIADIIAASSFEALKCSPRPFDIKYNQARSHQGQIATAANFRKILAESQIIESHKHCPKVQDPYCIRCIPQIHGAVRDVFKFARDVFMKEVNSSTDNPLVFAQSREIISGGNFHAQPLAFVADALAFALTTLANISQARIFQLNNPDTSGLPAFLIKESGINCGTMALEICSAALATENRVLSYPASVSSIPTGAGKEDIVSMSSVSVNKLRSIYQNLIYILAIEMFCACQGLDMLKPLKPGKGVSIAHKFIRSTVPPLIRDRVLTPDVEKIANILRTGKILTEVEKVSGELI